MSVKRELERWAAAQMANVTDPAQLARYIRRILRGVDTYKLEALGGAGFSGEQREARPGEKEATDVPGPVFALDSGLLVSSADPSYPLTIYCGTELAAYFASTGTEIIGRLVDGNPVYEFLVGVAEASETICSGAYAIPDWTDTAPTLDADNGYGSATWTSGTLMAKPQSSLYSGLMRLGVQCKIGARKAANDLCGFTTLDPTAHGLMLDKQTYTFWSVQVNSSGAAAKKLQNSESSECIREQLAAGDIAETSADYIRYLAWLISDLTPTTEPAIGVLTSGQVADVYSDGKLPIAHGWKFSRFSNKASIVTYRETVNGTIPCGESGLWTISLSFDGSGVPSASINEDTARTEFRVNPVYHCLWWPGDGKHNILRQALSSDPARYTTFSGAVAPIYCWYDKDDALQKIEYEQYATSTPGSYPYGENFGSTRACEGAPGYYQTRLHYSGSVFHSGGYVNTANPIAGAVDQYVSANVTEKTYNWSYGGETGRFDYDTLSMVWPGGISTRWGFYSSICADQYAAILDWGNSLIVGSPVYVASQYSHVYGGGTADITELTGEKLGFTNIQVIPSSDAESAYSVLLENWGTHSYAYTGYINEGVPTGDSYGNNAVWVQEEFNLRNYPPPYEYHDYPDGPQYHGISFGAPFSTTPATVGIMQAVVSSGATPASTDSDSGSEYYKAGGVLVSSSDSSLSISDVYSDWSYYIWSGIGSDELDQRVDALSSYNGSAIYDVDSTVPAIPGSNIEITGGYSLGYNELPTYKRWVGWV